MTSCFPTTFGKVEPWQAGVAYRFVLRRNPSGSWKLVLCKDKAPYLYSVHPTFEAARRALWACLQGLFYLGYPYDRDH